MVNTDAQNGLMDYRDIHWLTDIPINRLRVMHNRGQLPRPAHPRVAVWKREDIEEWWKRQQEKGRSDG